MTDTLLLDAHNKIEIAFGFLEQYGYDRSESMDKNVEHSEVTFVNNNIAKEINISINNYADVERFVISISIVRITLFSCK
jgi:hypothetical protein